MGGGGFLGKITEVATGGLVKSGDTKDKIKAAEQAQAEQAKVIKQQADEAKKIEEEKKKRILKSRQGRRSLMYQGTDETGVQTSGTLGG